MGANILELEQNFFENAWNAVARGNKIWGYESEFGEITFSITQRYFLGRQQTYHIKLKPAPVDFDGISQFIFCTVTGIDCYTKHNFSVNRKLSTLAFYRELRRNKYFDTAALYINGILSVECAQLIKNRNPLQ